MFVPGKKLRAQRRLLQMRRISSKMRRFADVFEKKQIKRRMSLRGGPFYVAEYSTTSLDVISRVPDMNPYHL